MNNLKTWLCLCPEDGLFEWIKRPMTSAGFALERWMPGIEIPASCTGLVVRSPIRIGTVYVRVEKVWKRFLHARYPESKLITFGFWPAEHPNYIDLLQFPRPDKALTERALKASENVVFPDTQGLELLEKLGRFFRGHDDSRQDSVSAALKSITYRLDALAAAAESKPFGDALEYILDCRDLESMGPDQNEKDKMNPLFLWRQFYSRWEAYFPLFAWTPFGAESGRLNQCVLDVNLVFQNGLKDKQTLEAVCRNIGDLHSVLNLIKQDYAG